MAIKSVVVATQFLESVVPILVQRLPGVQFKLVTFENAVPGKLDVELKVTRNDIQALQEAEFLIIDSFVIGQLAYELPNLRWMQACAAGLDSVTKSVTPQIIESRGAPNFILTRFSGQSYAGLMYEYCFCFIVNFERGFTKQIEHKSCQKWSTLKSFSPPVFRMVHELKITVLGTGAIGSRLAAMFKHHGCHVRGFGRRDRSDEEISQMGLDFYSTRIQDVISLTDYIINVMPYTQSTVGLLDGKFEFCQNRPVFINLGRGSVVNTDYLIQSLDQGLLSYAILDVFEKEPLHESSPLWTHGKVSITPHVSCETRAEDVAVLFTQNYHLYEAGKPLNNVYDWSENY